VLGFLFINFNLNFRALRNPHLDKHSVNQAFTLKLNYSEADYQPKGLEAKT